MSTNVRVSGTATELINRQISFGHKNIKITEDVTRRILWFLCFCGGYAFFEVELF